MPSTVPLAAHSSLYVDRLQRSSRFHLASIFLCCSVHACSEHRLHASTASTASTARCVYATQSSQRRAVCSVSAVRRNQSIIETTWELCRGVTTVVRHPDGTQIRVFSDGTHTETMCVHPTSVRLERVSELSTISGTRWTVWNTLRRVRCPVGWRGMHRWRVSELN